MNIKKLLKENSGMIISHSIAFLILYQLPRKVLEKTAWTLLAFHSIRLLPSPIIKVKKNQHEPEKLSSYTLTPDELGAIKEKVNQVDNRQSAANWLSWQFWKPSQILVETPKNLKH